MLLRLDGLLFVSVPWTKTFFALLILLAYQIIICPAISSR